MKGALGPREKLHLIIGGEVCDVYRDGFNCGSYSTWSVVFCFFLFGLLLLYYHMNRDRIHPSEGN
ncbi:hypothetical protein KR009_001815 [Drosophila setifemur]|nr:hypothetical protein KR009_001815 [Drosophila setifemur]